MATVKEINHYFNIICEDIDQTFKEHGLSIRTSQFDIKILSEASMDKQGYNGMYIPDRNEIQIRRADFTTLVNIAKNNPKIRLHLTYQYYKIKKNIIHEIAHQIHFEKLDKKDFNLRVIDSYGNKNYLERFAVAFQEYLMKECINNGIKPLLQGL